MDFNERGFLGSAVLEFVDSVEKRYPELLALCYRTNELAQGLKHDFRVNSADGQQVLALTLFVRVLNGFQAVVLLARLGLRTDAQVVARGLLEALFVLKLHGPARRYSGIKCSLRCSSRRLQRREKTFYLDHA